MAEQSFTYTTYIHATPDRLWTALTDPEQSLKYWSRANVSDWNKGSAWEHRRTDGTVDLLGRVLAGAPQRRLVLSWAVPADAGDPHKTSQVTFDLVPVGPCTRLDVTHEHIAGPGNLEALAEGWPRVLSSLKTYVETGKPLPGLYS